MIVCARVTLCLYDRERVAECVCIIDFQCVYNIENENRSFLRFNFISVIIFILTFIFISESTKMITYSIQCTRHTLYIMYDIMLIHDLTKHFSIYVHHVVVVVVVLLCCCV